MRVANAIVPGVLLFGAGLCFFAASGSAAQLRHQAEATARHVWLVPGLPTPSLERRSAPLAELSVEPRATEAEPEPEPEPVEPPAPRKHRRRAFPPAAPLALSTHVNPEDAIRMALRSKRASFEYCYERELKKQAAFNGFIVVALSLSSSGSVTEARVHEGNRRDARVGACIVAQLRTMKLPPLTSAADLLIPIRLQALEPT